MKIHHFDAGTFCPLLGGTVVTHCLLVETPRDGLVLVDTGFGEAATADPRRLHWSARWQLRPRFYPEDAALRHVRALGHAASDVRHIVITHLDGDHAGGILDFPEATVHIHAPELETLRRGSSRYDATLRHADVRWAPYTVDGESWHGFACVRPLPGLRDDLALVPLPGHTQGHAGVAISGDDGWLLHAGDAYLESVQIRRPDAVPWSLRLAAWITATSQRARRDNLARLHALGQAHPEITIVCSHDPDDLARCVHRHAHAGPPSERPV